MDQARRLLDGGRLSITEVALAVGYQTPSAFAQAFQSAVGETPTPLPEAPLTVLRPATPRATGRPVTPERPAPT
jgi:AraC-like DNA-binding protein